ncbi:MAG: amino acid decarboxylase, partial [bacterium]
TAYLVGGTSRLHMPGHKGAGPLGCECRDITEIFGADALYEADGIIAESEQSASLLFGSGATFYSAEGSSQCLRAMLYLAMANRSDATTRPMALAARNAHKSLLYAAALCDFDVEWLWPEGGAASVCACPVTPTGLERRLSELENRPFCVLLTSPDYLGGTQAIAPLAAVCHAHDIPILVDNAHGAYLKFLPQSLHPLDQGADMCCDSAHKTLPALTGAAYLHISKDAPRYIEGARDALALFGSTSPSYLILQSLDLCNATLSGDFPTRLARTAARLDALKRRLTAIGHNVLPTEPMKLTLAGDGHFMADALRRGGVECEYADGDFVVLMFSPSNTEADFARVESALKNCVSKGYAPEPLALPRPPRAMTIRQAVFAPSEVVPIADAVGRVCAAPTVACPPAVPIAVSGERITRDVAALFRRYGMENLRVVR